MSNIRILLDRISTNFAIINSKIALENKANDQSLNVFLESTVLRIINIVYEKEYTNANRIRKDFPGVDGIDITNSEMIQITSTFSSKKITDTIEQINKENLYSDFKTLNFFFLKDISNKQLTNEFTKKVDEKVNSNFQFNLRKNLFDLNDIYQKLKDEQDVPKILNVLNILDNVLEIIPENKKSGFESVSISFHDEEISNVELLINSLANEGINIFINSKLLYKKLKDQRKSIFDYVIFTENISAISYVNYTIVVLSNTYILNNFVNNYSNKCIILSNAISNENKFYVISFDPFLKHRKEIKDTLFSSYSSINSNTIDKKVKEILKTLFAESVYSTYSFEDIKDSLISSYPAFKVEEIDNNNEYYLINFKSDVYEEMSIAYMILKNEYSIQNVSRLFNNTHSLKYSKALVILTPKDFTHKSRRRLNIISTNFPTAKVFYVDEHLFDRSLRKIEQKTILTINDFIDPIVRLNDELLRINDVIEWIINNNDSSVGIIKAAGGIGKTTFCEKIHDIIVKEHERYLVIFIDSAKYIEEFRKKNYTTFAEYDLYTIFKNCHLEGSTISRNSFYLNLSLGNIIMIFDGVDEIISTIPSFSLNSFLTSIENLRDIIGKGKILINCRDNYIDDLENFYFENANSKTFQMYELLGFNDKLANSYFSKHFSENEVLTCKKLLDEFYPQSTGNSNAYVYHPFTLEIIVKIVGSNFKYKEVVSEFNTKFLLYNDSNDLLIYRILKREILKKEDYGFHLSVDKQIMFLCFMAIEEKGQIEDEKRFEYILQNIGILERLNEVKKGLIDHPLLTNIGTKYTFRFDFFNTYFKSVSIFYKIVTTSEDHITERMINSIAYDCNINSVISKTVIKKISKSEITFQNILKNGKNLINCILNYNISTNGLIERKQKAISNLFLLFHSASIENHFNPALIMKTLFENEKEEIENFYLIDIPENINIYFDFSGYYFTNSHIKGYLNFFKCKFDELAFFDSNCSISNVFNPKIEISKISASSDNFHKKIDGDNSVFKVVRSKEDGEKELTKYFKIYFKNFIHNKQLIPCQIKSLSVINDEEINNDILSEILVKNFIIDRIESEIIYINSSFIQSINTLLKQDVPFKELNHSINDLRTFLIQRRISEDNKKFNL